MIKQECSIKLSTITEHTLQANSILESIHQTIGNMICTFELRSNEIDKKSIERYFSGCHVHN